MTLHITDFYKDGFSRVEFCKMCGKEGSELKLNCIPIIENDPTIKLVKNYQEKMLTNSRNFPKSKELNNLFNMTKMELK
jgi:hypothetical protein